MKKSIGVFSVFLGLYGTIAVLFRTFDPDWIQKASWLFYSPVQFTYSFSATVSWSAECVFHLMMLTGGVIYLRKLSDRSGLLRFCFSIIFFCSVIRILWKVFALKLILSQDHTLQYLLWTLYHIALLLISYWVIKFMQKDFIREETSLEGPSAEENNLFKSPAPTNLRLAHFIFDFLIVLGLMSPLMELFALLTTGKHTDFYKYNRFIFLLIVGFHRFIYYGLIESIFKVSPVKFLTGTSVVNEFGPGVPSPSRFWSRTLCRFIPFEPFSFLGRQGWHDALTQSIVVKENHIRPGKPLAGVWISLLLILPIGRAGINFYQEQHRQMLGDAYYDEVLLGSRKSIINHLSTDDLIVYRSLSYSKNQVRRIFKVEQVDPDTLWGYTFNMDEGRTEYKNVLSAYQKSTLGDNLKSIPRKNLETMILENKNGDLFGDGQRYDNDISIFTLHQPVITMGSSNTQKRTGEAAKANWTILVENEMISLKSITTLEGDILWKTTLPLEINWSQDKGFFKVTAENFEGTKRHQSLFIFEDDEGRQFEYIGLGMGCELQLFRK